ncbi:putative reverse transcriptase domain-containing protein [Tanacetum coccineum]
MTDKSGGYPKTREIASCLVIGTLEMVGLNICHWSSFHTITVITLALRLHPLKHFMVENVVHLFAGLRLGKSSLTGPVLVQKNNRRSFQGQANGMQTARRSTKELRRLKALEPLNYKAEFRRAEQGPPNTFNLEVAGLEIMDREVNHLRTKSSVPIVKERYLTPDLERSMTREECEGIELPVRRRRTEGMEIEDGEIEIGANGIEMGIMHELWRSCLCYDLDVPDEEDRVEGLSEIYGQHSRECDAANQPLRIRIDFRDRDCRSAIALKHLRAQLEISGLLCCYECGRPGHFRKDFAKVKKSEPWKPDKGLLGHPFRHRSTGRERGSFDVIIWYGLVGDSTTRLLVWTRKVARISYGNESYVQESAEDMSEERRLEEYRSYGILEHSEMQELSSQLLEPFLIKDYKPSSSPWRSTNLVVKKKMVLVGMCFRLIGSRVLLKIDLRSGYLQLRALCGRHFKDNIRTAMDKRERIMKGHLKFDLGFIEEGSIHVDPAKIEAIKDWRPPRMSSEVSNGEKRPEAVIPVVDAKAVYVRPILALPRRKEDDTLEKFTRQYLKEVVSKHGVPVSIISDRDGKFTSHFWKSLHKALEDMLRACILDFGKGWDKHLPLVEFSYNNSYHTSIKAAPFESFSMAQVSIHLICRRKFWGTVAHWLEIIHEGTPERMFKSEPISKRRDRQKSYADSRKLKKGYGEESACYSVVQTFNVADKLNFIKEPVEIMDREVKHLKQSRILIVKERIKKDKKKQKQSKTNKKREKDKETRARVRNQPENKAGSARHSKKESQGPQLKVKGPRMTSVQSFKGLCEVIKFKDQVCQKSKVEY